MPDYKNGIINLEDFDALCMSDVKSTGGVKVVQSPLYYTSPWIRRLQIRHERWGRKYHVPFKHLWYPFFFKDDFNNNKPYCFVITNNRLPLQYLHYLRIKYPNCRIVKVYRDLVCKEAQNPEYTEADIKDICDMRFSYDLEDCEHFGLTYFHNYHSYLNVISSKSYPLCDIFFCGTAKDRLGKLIQMYDKLTSAGVKCKFYIAFAHDEEKVYRDGITYADKYMPYKEVLFNSINARCLLDINQGGAHGYSIRFMEAVMYNKRLITDNYSVKDSPFYCTKYMQVIDNVEDIDLNFIFSNGKVDYHYNGEFSPIHLIELIDKSLLLYNDKQ